MALKPYLGGKPLKSRKLFRQFLDRRPQATPQASAGVAATRKAGGDGADGDEGTQ